MMLADTTHRVQENSSKKVNERMQTELRDRINYYSNAGRSKIEQKLAELNRESDIERAIEVEAPLMMLTGIALGTRVHRGFFVLPVFAASMVLLHGFQGWYPLIPIFRKLGFRTTREINDERHQLMILKEESHAA